MTTIVRGTIIQFYQEHGYAEAIVASPANDGTLVQTYLYRDKETVARWDLLANGCAPSDESVSTFDAAMREGGHLRIVAELEDFTPGSLELTVSKWSLQPDDDWLHEALQSGAFNISGYKFELYYPGAAPTLSGTIEKIDIVEQRMIIRLEGVRATLSYDLAGSLPMFVSPGTISIVLQGMRTFLVFTEPERRKAQDT